jgi:hypothetical protein
MKCDVIALGVTESCLADRAGDRQRVEQMPTAVAYELQVTAENYFRAFK